MLQIKKIGVADINLVRELAYEIWPIAYKEILTKDQLIYMLDLIYSKKALNNQIENSGHQFIIVTDHDKAVGFASYSPKKPGDATTYRLHKLYVMTSQQGKGIGKYLLNYIINEIKQTGAKKLELNVNRHNSAFYFYRKMGFVIVKEEDIDIGGGYFMNDYVMSCEL